MYGARLSLPEVIEATAQRQLMTPSEYIRRSVFDRLKADGADLASLAGQSDAWLSLT